MSEKRGILRNMGGFEVHYREITVEDIPSVKSLHNELFPVKYDPEFYDSLLYNPHRHCMLATIASSNDLGYTVIGVLTYRIKKLTRSTRRITEWWNGFTQQPHAYIMTFGVTAKYRKLGVGAFLMEKMINQATKSGVMQISLHVLRSNHNAVRFYCSHGFEIVCLLKEYYNIADDIGDAFWLRRDLTKAKTIFEPPVFEHSIRSGPWPLGLSFEGVLISVLALSSAFLLLVTALLSQT